MTTDPVPLGLKPFSHLKADPTTSSSKSTAIPASPTITPIPSQLPRPQPLKNASSDEHVNGTSDKATAALIRRVLCPQSGSYGGATSPYAPEELLPPLTSSNNIDRQLYALIAIIVKEFISSWYSKITSDQALINEVLQVIAHCTRALEQRARGADIAQLVLDEIPGLVEAHIISLSPIPDLSDTKSISHQQDNEATYRRLLVNGVLAALLPTEDLENACLRTLMNDILADLILGNEVSGKVCEGWFLWESTTKLLDVLSREKHVGHGDNTAVTESSRPNRLQQFGLLSSKNGENDCSSSTIQSQASSWIWHILQYAFLAYMTLRFIVAGLFRVASTPPVALTSRPSLPGSLVDELPTKYGHIGKRPVLGYRLYGMLSQLLDIPQRMPWLGGLLALFQYLIVAGPGRVGDTGSVLDRFLHENIEEHVLTPTLLPNLLLASREALFPHNTRPKPGASENRIEVLTSTPTPTPPISGAQPSTINDAQTTTASGGNAITPASMATTAGSAPLSPDQQRRPSPAEIALIRRKCAVRILSLIPRPIAHRLLGIPAEIGSEKHPLPDQSLDRVQESEPGSGKQDPSSSPEPSRAAPSPSASTEGDAEDSLLSAVENDILDLFADEYCNKHLIYSIIETVLAKLLPELSDRSIAELMEDRGVFLPTG
ncbi:PXA domain-containing protein [Aspergillus cavernicola]|uniref:PXA domain-containing protein n=1 Tax=Aspergillus cavernicola TaxID=176166 RepID=A0ABR4IGJ5_9EURO